MARRPHPRGFTLVELLVALFVMSLVAVLAWRGLDGMTRTQAATQERADRVLALQVGLAQWSTDLDAVVQVPDRSALDWNGRVLRMTRRAPPGAPAGLVVAAWTLRVVGGQPTWLRWQSVPLASRGELEQAWQRADTWSQTPGDAERAVEVAVTPLVQWQVFFHRGGAWTNPLSSDEPTSGTGTTSPAATGRTGQARSDGSNVLPDGVRAVLTLPAEHPLGGTLTLDWASPRVSGVRS
jgi:general secretion pathway protein J